MADKFIDQTLSSVDEWYSVVYSTLNGSKWFLDQLANLVYQEIDFKCEGKELLKMMALADIMLCEINLGHDPLSNKREVLPLDFAYYKCFAAEGEQFTTYMAESKVSTQKHKHSLYDSYLVSKKDDTLSFNLSYYLDKIGLYKVNKTYHRCLYNISEAIAIADEHISLREDLWMRTINESVASIKVDDDKKEEKENEKPQNHIATKQVEESAEDTKEERNVKEKESEYVNPVEELNSLIGLDKVKTEVSNLHNLLKMQKMREQRGLKISKMSYHCVFTGNPGTGKTTVARIIAKIYKELGVLKSGHLVETDRSGLVADYVGQTATKTNKIIDKAIDGVLFIDEAYSLTQGSQNDFGKEAISTLLKRMEDDRDKLVVILAGYSNEMEGFINSNSGLKSRFNRYIDFPDYSSSELQDIFKLFLQNNGLKASEDALTRLSIIIDNAVKHKDTTFGNARFIRNLFESTIVQQANRLSTMESISDEDLSTIESSDILYNMKVDREDQPHKRIGFK